MRILKASSLAVVVVLTLASSVWADSVITPSAFQADLQIVQKSISSNQKLFLNSPAAQGAFLAGQLAGVNALILNALGNTKGAQLSFQTAIADFNQVLSALNQPTLSSSSYSAPDAGSLALLSCAGLALFGALKKKYSN